mmetsp:Transcript_57793/g.183199  ORF Transcript_57793/g.183199 Transcript_57793/m.183199 type:complete len:337 (+) Transcript_57793:2631-3641(+)
MCTPTLNVPLAVISMERASSRSRAVGGSMEKMRCSRKSRRFLISSCEMDHGVAGRHASASSSNSAGWIWCWNMSAAVSVSMSPACPSASRTAASGMGRLSFHSVTRAETSVCPMLPRSASTSSVMRGMSDGGREDALTSILGRRGSVGARVRCVGRVPAWRSFSLAARSLRSASAALDEAPGSSSRYPHTRSRRVDVSSTATTFPTGLFPGRARSASRSASRAASAVGRRPGVLSTAGVGGDIPWALSLSERAPTASSMLRGPSSSPSSSPPSSPCICTPPPSSPPPAAKSSASSSGSSSPSITPPPPPAGMGPLPPPPGLVGPSPPGSWPASSPA